MKVAINPKKIGGVALGGLALGIVWLAGRASNRPAPPLVFEGANVYAPDAPPTLAPLRVDVKGAVKRPGVYEFPVGARFEDAIQKAGGTLPEADLDRYNRAAPLKDGVAVVIARRGETPPPVTEPEPSRPRRSRRPRPLAGGIPPLEPLPVPSGDYEVRPAETPEVEAPRIERSRRERAAPSAVNVNTAGAEELDRLPGVGPAIAGRILAYREANGPFASVEDLLKVKGIGPKTLEKMREWVRL